MIDLYTWTTPNGRKASVMLEEIGLAYAVHPVNIGKGEQHTPDFKAINPVGKIPAIVDHDGPGGQPIKVFESGAILLYLAEKTGKLIPADARGRSRVVEWLMFQMGNLGPMLGQYFYFMRSAPEPVPAAIQRYREQADRFLGVMEQRLGEAEYLADDYSIADIACYPWVGAARFLELVGEDQPNLRRWLDAVGDRPAVRKGMAVPKTG